MWTKQQQLIYSSNYTKQGLMLLNYSLFLIGIGYILQNYNETILDVIKTSPYIILYLDDYTLYIVAKELVNKRIKLKDMSFKDFFKTWLYLYVLRVFLYHTFIYLGYPSIASLLMVSFFNTIFPSFNNTLLNLHNIGLPKLLIYINLKLMDYPLLGLRMREYLLETIWSDKPIIITDANKIAVENNKAKTLYVTNKITVENKNPKTLYDKALFWSKSKWANIINSLILTKETKVKMARRGPIISKPIETKFNFLSVSSFDKFCVNYNMFPSNKASYKILYWCFENKLNPNNVYSLTYVDYLKKHRSPTPMLIHKKESFGKLMYSNTVVSLDKEPIFEDKNRIVWDGLSSFDGTIISRKISDISADLKVWRSLEKTLTNKNAYNEIISKKDIDFMIYSLEKKLCIWSHIPSNLREIANELIVSNSIQNSRQFTIFTSSVDNDVISNIGIESIDRGSENSRVEANISGDVTYELSDSELSDSELSDVPLAQFHSEYYYYADRFSVDFFAELEKFFEKYDLDAKLMTRFSIMDPHPILSNLYVKVDRTKNLFIKYSNNIYHDKSITLFKRINGLYIPYETIGPNRKPEPIFYFEPRRKGEVRSIVPYEIGELVYPYSPLNLKVSRLYIKKEESFIQIPWLKREESLLFLNNILNNYFTEDNSKIISDSLNINVRKNMYNLNSIKFKIEVSFYKEVKELINKYPWWGFEDPLSLIYINNIQINKNNDQLKPNFNGFYLRYTKSQGKSWFYKPYNGVKWLQKLGIVDSHIYILIYKRSIRNDRTSVYIETPWDKLDQANKTHILEYKRANAIQITSDGLEAEHGNNSINKVISKSGDPTLKRKRVDKCSPDPEYLKEKIEKLKSLKTTLKLAPGLLSIDMKYLDDYDVYKDDDYNLILELKKHNEDNSKFIESLTEVNLSHNNSNAYKDTDLDADGETDPDLDADGETDWDFDADGERDSSLDTDGETDSSLDTDGERD